MPSSTPGPGRGRLGAGRLAESVTALVGRVLVNTVKSALRRPRGPARATAARERPALACPLAPRFATLALALAGLAMIVLWLTGGLTGTSSGPRGCPRPTLARRPLAPGVQARAAAWITAQVSGNAMVACYPGRVRRALQEQGVAAGRLMPLQSAAASPLGASVLVTSPSISGQMAGSTRPR